MYEKHLADKEKHLDNKEKHLDDKEKHLANKEKHLDDKEKHLDNKEKHLDDKEKQLTDTEKQLADKKTQVEVLKQKFLPPVDVPNASEYYRRKENIDKSEIQAIQAIQALNHISVPTLSHNHALLDANEIKALLGDFYDPKRSAHLPIDKYNNELLLQRLSYMPEFRFNDNTRIKIQQSSGSLSIVSSSGSGKTAAILQHLSTTYGFYLVCNRANDEDNSYGRSVNETLDRGIIKLHAALKTTTQDNFDMQVRRVVLMFFFLKCKFLRHAISKSSVPVTPLSFLELQLNDNSTVFGDFFSEALLAGYHMKIVYEDLLTITRTELAQLLKQLNTESFVVAVDEAQSFVKCFDDLNVYSINGKAKQGCLLSMLLWQTHKIVPNRISTLIITSGTGYSNDHQDICMSTLGKGFKLEENALSAPLLYSVNQIIHYLQVHINLPKECIEWIKSPEFYNSYLPIRIRFVAHVIAEMIRTPLQTLPLLEYFQNAWKTSTSMLLDHLKQKKMDSLSTEALTNFYKLSWRHFTQELQHLIPTESFAQLVVTSHCVHYQLQSVKIFSNSTKKVLSVHPTEPFFRRYLESKFSSDWLYNTMQWLIYERISPTSRNYFEVLVFLALSKFHQQRFYNIPWISEKFHSSQVFYCEKIVNPATLRIYLANLDFQIPSNDELISWASTFFPEKKELKVIRKNRNLLIEEDLLFWFVASKQDSAKLLNGIAYRPSSNANPDFLILLPESNFIVSVTCKLSDSKTNDHIRKRLVNNIAQASPHFFYQPALPESIKELKGRITTSLPPPWRTWKWLCVPVFYNVCATDIPTKNSNSVWGLSFDELSSPQLKYVPLTLPDAIFGIPPLVDSWLKMQFLSYQLEPK